MNIVSWEFLLFSTVLIGTYFVIPRKFQWVVIFFSNLVFYFFAGIPYIGYMLIISVATFLGALQLKKAALRGKEQASLVNTPEEKKVIKEKVTQKKKLITGLAIVLSMGIWAVLKYTNFFIDNLNLPLKWFSDSIQIERVSWVLPLGISFYTFHAVGYLVDVYRNKYTAERNYFKFFAFISYFPHIVQGPFSRYDELGKSIGEEHKFSYERLCEGCARILWGYFKKMVVADKIGIAATSIFADSSQYSGIYMMFAMCAYGIQLYADFSGYMDIVCGLSHILGIKLAENFKRPYFAKSVDEFWRRWHITLGTWFRDYVFYPVSMGKTGQKMGKWARKKWGAKMGKLLPGYFALIFVWTATGLWHGANWTYLIWGYLNLFVIVLSMQLTDFYDKVKEKLHINSEQLWWKIVAIVRTFILVCFFRFFSAAPDIQTAMSMLTNTFGDMHFEVLKNPMYLFVGVEYVDIYFSLIGTIFIFAVDLFEEAGVWNKVKEKCPVLIKNVCYVTLIMFIMMCAGSVSELMGGFMYASF
ncbi:MAG: MBOAT family protein [Lachnospiraceae bacterium]|nr:MBOAT family protein [Lachnospiraceae bacterium]